MYSEVILISNCCGIVASVTSGLRLLGLGCRIANWFGTLFVYRLDAQGVQPALLMRMGPPPHDGPCFVHVSISPPYTVLLGLKSNCHNLLSYTDEGEGIGTRVYEASKALIGG